MVTLSKQNEAIEFKTISMDLIRNLKFAGYVLVIANLTALLMLIILEPRFADAALKYSFFTLIYITSLVCTVFALKDNNNVMLYPILVTTVAFVIIPLWACLFVLLNRFYCTHLNDAHTVFAYYECQNYWDISLLWSIPLLLIIFANLFEFIIFRRLMKIFEMQRCNAHFCVTDVSKAFSTRNDTDDEIIVYERVTKGCQTSYNDYGVYKQPNA